MKRKPVPPTPSQTDGGNRDPFKTDADQLTHDLNQIEYSICTLSIQAGQVRPVDDHTCDFQPNLHPKRPIKPAADQPIDVQIPAEAHFPFRIVDQHFANSYRKIQYLASGGFGRVFSAIDETGRTVALKILTNADAAPRFRHETNIAAQLGADSDHCIKVHSRGTIQCLDPNQQPVDLPYVDMEFISDTLRSQINGLHQPTTSEKGKPIERLRQLLNQYFIPACHGIAHAHSRGILHRDIKPANIGVTQIAGTQRVRVIDWGLAKVLDDETEVIAIPETSTLLSLRRVARDLSIDASIAGTPAYMAPEQAIAAPLTSACDIYALGVCLFEILTGSIPFAGKRPLDIIRYWQATLNVLPGQPVASINVAETLLQQVIANSKPASGHSSLVIPLPLKQIVYKAMSVDPSRRYATATALANDVQAWLTDRLPIAQRESLSSIAAVNKRVRLWAGRNRRAIAIGTMSVILATVFGTLSILAIRNTLRDRADAAIIRTRISAAGLEELPAILTETQNLTGPETLKARSIAEHKFLELSGFDKFVKEADEVTALAAISIDRPLSLNLDNDITIKKLNELLQIYADAAAQPANLDPDVFVNGEQKVLNEKLADMCLARALRNFPVFFGTSQPAPENFTAEKKLAMLADCLTWIGKAKELRGTDNFASKYLELICIAKRDGTAMPAIAEEDKKDMDSALDIAVVLCMQPELGIVGVESSRGTFTEEKYLEILDLVDRVVANNPHAWQVHLMEAYFKQVSDRDPTGMMQAATRADEKSGSSLVSIAMLGKIIAGEGVDINASLKEVERKVVEVKETLRALLEKSESGIDLELPALKTLFLAVNRQNFAYSQHSAIDKSARISGYEEAVITLRRIIELVESPQEKNMFRTYLIENLSDIGALQGMRWREFTENGDMRAARQIKSSAKNNLAEVEQIIETLGEGYKNREATLSDYTQALGFSANVEQALKNYDKRNKICRAIIDLYKEALSNNALTATDAKIFANSQSFSITSQKFAEEYRALVQAMIAANLIQESIILNITAEATSHSKPILVNPG